MCVCVDLDTYTYVYIHTYNIIQAEYDAYCPALYAKLKGESK